MAKYLAMGQFAAVFDIGAGRVLKAYRQLDHGCSTAAANNEYGRLSCDAEEGIYRLLASEAALAPYREHFPTFYGRVDPGDFDLPEGHPAGLLLPGCGLVLELLVGDEEKVSDLEPDLHDKINGLLSDVQDVLRPVVAGRWSTSGDASRFIPGRRGARFVLVDFTVSNEAGALFDGG